MLDAQGMRDTFFREDPPGAALGSQMKRSRIGTIHWNTEAYGKLALEFGRVVRNQMRAIGVDDQRSNLLQQAWSREQFPAERLRRPVERRDPEEPFSRMAGKHPQEKVEIVIDNLGMDCLGRDVNQARLRLPQEQKEKQKSASPEPAA